MSLLFRPRKCHRTKALEKTGIYMIPGHVFYMKGSGLRTRTDKMDLLDLVSSDDNIQARLFDMSPSSFIRGKFSDVKYMFEEAKLLFTNFYFSRKAK